MKCIRYCSGLLLLLLPFLVFGQFGPPVYVDDNAHTASQIISFDSNEDTMLDIAILFHSEHFNSILLQDVNTDGAQDVITTMGQQGRVIWIPNDGDGDFALPQLIHDEPDQLLYQMTGADFNGDGHRDICWGDKISAVQYLSGPSAVMEEGGSPEFYVYPNPHRERNYARSSISHWQVLHL